MLLEKESHVLEKLKLLSVAFDYAEKKGQILDSNLYHGSAYKCPPKKEVIEFMETFHALDAFVYGTCTKDSLFGCDAANHWTIQVGYSESAPTDWYDTGTEAGACAVITYNRHGERRVRVFQICDPIATVYTRLFFYTKLHGESFAKGFTSSDGIVTEV
jgi:hypothetical protein